MWRMGHDSAQNQVIMHVQGLHSDPVDHPDNKQWLRCVSASASCLRTRGLVRVESAGGTRGWWEKGMKTSAIDFVGAIDSLRTWSTSLLAQIQSAPKWHTHVNLQGKLFLLPVAIAARGAAVTLPSPMLYFRVCTRMVQIADPSEHFMTLRESSSNRLLSFSFFLRERCIWGSCRLWLPLYSLLLL